MKLRITDPTAILVDTDVRSVRAEDASGSFGILSGLGDNLLCFLDRSLQLLLVLLKRLGRLLGVEPRLLDLVGNPLFTLVQPPGNGAPGELEQQSQ